MKTILIAAISVGLASCATQISPEQAANLSKQLAGANAALGAYVNATK